MAREYTVGSVRKQRGKWQALIKYREVQPDEAGGEKGGYRQLTKMLEVKSRPGASDNTGRAKAEQLLKEWRDDLVRTEAQRAEAEGLNRRSRGITVASYVETYIGECAAGIEPSSLSSYKKILRNQIAPYIGDIGISELTPEQVSQWQQGLLQKYSPATVRKSFMMLRSAMKRAMERDLLAKDPTRTVKATKIPRHKPNALDAEGRGKVMGFVNIDPADPVSIGVRIILYCGLREAEACGLRWRNVDTKARTLRVCEAIGRADKADIPARRVGSATHAEMYLKDPKNERRIRTVCYPDDLARALELRKARVQRECRKAGVPFSKDMFVMGRPNGAPIHPHSFCMRWRTVAAALGLVGTQGHPVTINDLRHTYATTAIAHHVDVKTVSSSMGHTNAAMTLNTYASADPDAAARAAYVLGRAYAEEMEAALEPGAPREGEG